MAEIVNADPTAERSALIDAAAKLRPVIRGYQAEIERERRVPRPLLDQLRAAGVYRLLVPRVLGGAEVDLPTLHRVVELIAEGDASVAWNVANTGSFVLASLSLSDEGVHEIYADGPDVCFAGNLGPRGGRGRALDGGYVVTGRWPFGSGCQEADWLMGSFEPLDGDEPRKKQDGSPVLLRGFFRAADCRIIETWDTTGLRGTGSHDWELSEVFVPECRTVPHPGQPAKNAWSHRPGALYSLPGGAVIGPHLSAVATGAARAAIDAMAELAGKKMPLGRPNLVRDLPQVQEAIGRAEALLGAGRAYREAVAAELWETASVGQPVTVEQMARCRLASCLAADNAMQAVDLMFRAGSTTSIEASHLIGRCWRDVHAVGQHVNLMPEFYTLAGRVFLGLDPGPRLS
jgi:indole-3-acetate monooxygenase